MVCKTHLNSKQKEENPFIYWHIQHNLFYGCVRERNVLFNDALNTFYLRLYGVRHMVKDHSDSERGNPLPPHRLLFSISSKGSFICTITHRITHTTTFVTPVVEHWLEREIAQWVDSMKDRSDDPLHHERTLLPRSYISLHMALSAHSELTSPAAPVEPWASGRWLWPCRGWSRTRRPAWWRPGSRGWARCGRACPARSGAGNSAPGKTSKTVKATISRFFFYHLEFQSLIKK